MEFGLGFTVSLCDLIFFVIFYFTHRKPPYIVVGLHPQQRPLQTGGCLPTLDATNTLRPRAQSRASSAARRTCLRGGGGGVPLSSCTPSSHQTHPRSRPADATSTLRHRTQRRASFAARFDWRPDDGASVQLFSRSPLV